MAIALSTTIIDSLGYGRLTTTPPVPVAATAAVGAATTAARADHRHALPTWLEVNTIQAGSTAGIGDARLCAGDASHTGWVGYYDWNGTRRGYQGFAADTGRLVIAADTGAGTPGWDFQQRPSVNGVNVALVTEVAGNGEAVDNTLVLRTTVSGTPGSIKVGDVMASRSATSGALFLGSNAAHYLYNDGTTMTATKPMTAPSFTPTSDPTIKYDIDPAAAGALDRIVTAGAGTIEFNRISDDVRARGFSALTLRDIDPLYVVGQPDQWGPDPTTGLMRRIPMSVDPMAIIADLCASIAALRDQVQALQTAS